mmetsp:Transcript_12197/g.36598  ORF Transcript_12197/g.36598 Transcript_12197/m.36598 type:complete len:331 (+) Transcript_12197:1206-2198(+)
MLPHQPHLSLLAGFLKLIEGGLAARTQPGRREGHQEGLPQCVRQPQVAVAGAQHCGGAPRAHALPRQRSSVVLRLRHCSLQTCQWHNLQERLVGASQAHNAPAAATSSRKSNHQGVWSEQEQLMGAPHAADGLSDGQTGKCTELRPHDCESHRILVRQGAQSDLGVPGQPLGLHHLGPHRLLAAPPRVELQRITSPGPVGDGGCEGDAEEGAGMQADGALAARVHQRGHLDHLPAALVHLIHLHTGGLVGTQLGLGHGGGAGLLLLPRLRLLLAHRPQVRHLSVRRVQHREGGRFRRPHQVGCDAVGELRPGAALAGHPDDVVAHVRPHH